MRASGQANRPNERKDGRTDGRNCGRKYTHALTLGYRETNRVCTYKEISSVRRVRSGRWSEREARQTRRLVQHDSTTGGRRPWQMWEQVFKRGKCV